MSTGSKKSKSYITVRYLEGQGSIYYIHKDGFLPQFIAVDHNGKPMAFKEKRFPVGSLIGSSKTDFVGNKPVFHEKAHGTIDYFLVQLGFTFQLSFYPSPTTYFYKHNWSGSGNHYITTLGKGLDRFGRHRDWLDVLSNNSGSAHYNLYYNVNSTKTDKVGSTILTLKSISSVDIGKPTTLVYNTSTKLIGRYASGSQPWRNGSYDTEYRTHWEKLIDFNIANAVIPAPTIPKSVDISLASIQPDTMVDDIYDQFTIPDVNNIENLKDLKDIKRSLPPLVNLLKKHSFKSLAEFYLWYKYSYSTTMLDLREYAKYISAYFTDQVSSRSFRRISLGYAEDTTKNGYSINHVTRYHIYTDNVSCGLLKSLGIDLTLSNVWDLLPFSFVVDWFINISNSLSQLDEISFLSKVAIRSVVISDKSIIHYSPYGSKVYPLSVTFSRYTRRLDNLLPLSAQSPSISNPSRHIVDGTALLIANKRFKK